MLQGNVYALHQIIDGEIFFKTVALAIKTALIPAAQIEHSLAQGFTGYGSRMHGYTTDRRFALDDSHLLPQFCRLYGCPLSGRPTSNDQKIVSIHAGSLSYCSR